MEAFSHFITTDDCIAHSCRRRGRRGCLSCTPTLFFFFSFPSLYFPQKETKKGSINALRIYVKYHVENDFIPRFPSLLWTSSKQEILQALRQSAGFLIPAPSRKSSVFQSSTGLDVASGKVWSCVPSQGLLPAPQSLFSCLFPAPEAQLWSISRQD